MTKDADLRHKPATLGSAGDVREGILWRSADPELRDRALQLEQSEANYRAIFDAANDAIFVHDAQTGQILDVNQKMTEMYGCTVEEARAFSIEDLSAGVPPYTQVEALEWLTKARASGAQLFEWLAKDKQERHFWVEVNIKPAVIAGQERLLAVVRDISERKQAEEQHALLAAEEARRVAAEAVLSRVQREEQRTREALEAERRERNTLDAILNSMSEAVFEVDTQGRLIRINQGTCKLVGKPAEELLNHTAWEVFRWEDETGRLLDLEEYAYRESLEARRATEHRNRFLRLPDGKRVAVAISSTPIFDSNGQVIAVVQVVRDVTKEREADQLKGQVISVAAHELRTPLAHIKGFTSSLLDPEVEWEATTRSDFLAEIDHEVDRVSALVSDLLDMSKIEAGADFLQKDLSDPALIVHQALKTAKQATSQHNVKVDIASDLPTINMDAGRIERVLTNLLVNAANYSPLGTDIRLTISPDDGWLIFVVSDQGPGIPPEYQERIFEKFFRMKTDSGRAPGSGLGLPIARGMVEAHGGQLWLESEVGQGARFSFCLPVSDPETGVSDEKAVPAPRFRAHLKPVG